MPDMSVDTAAVLAGLEKVNQKVRQVENTIKSSNSANAASMNTLAASINTAKTSEDGFTASVTANTASATMNSAAIAAETASLGLLNANLLASIANLNMFTASYNASTMAVGANSAALGLNSMMLMANNASRMLHIATTTLHSMTTDFNSLSFQMNTIGLTANTGALLLNSLGIAQNTIESTANTLALTANSGALLVNALSSLLSTGANFLNFVSLLLLNNQLKKQEDSLKKINKGLKENAKGSLIAALANLGNWIATMLLNSAGKKNIATTQAQTRSQNLYNAALAAAAILKNPIIGAATVAGAALAQGLMSGQKTEPVTIEMGAVEQSSSREVGIGEVFTSKRGGGGSSESDFVYDHQFEKLSEVNITAEASALTGKTKSLNHLATGGIVTRPTFALIGEGKYDEAVLPLGNSPQMRNLKNDIANAVVQSLVALRNMSARENTEDKIILNLDGQKMAQILLPKLAVEQKKRTGYKVV